jgi:predicted anti-sigma-YlaC factor YlaD
MTDCPNAEIRDLLPELMHDRLDALARVRVEAHLATCTDCRDELALLRAARAALSVARPVDVAGIVRALPTAVVASRTTTRVAAWRRWRAAAVIAVLATGGVTLATIERSDDVAGRDTPIARVTGSEGYALSVGGALGDLTDAQLRGLLEGLEELDVLPSPEPDAAVPAAVALEETL